MGGLRDATFRHVGVLLNPTNLQATTESGFPGIRSEGIRTLVLSQRGNP